MKKEPKESMRNRNHKGRVYVRLANPPKDALAQQQFKDECDMNHIVKAAQRGVPPRFLTRGTPQFGDFSNVPDLATAQQMLQDAQEAFMNLPAELRFELGNDPTRINELTEEQARRFKLLKAELLQPSPPTPSQPDPEPAPAAPGRKPDPKPTKKVDGDS